MLLFFFVGSTEENNAKNALLEHIQGLELIIAAIVLQENTLRVVAILQVAKLAPQEHIRAKVVHLAPHALVVQYKVQKDNLLARNVVQIHIQTQQELSVLLVQQVQHQVLVQHIVKTQTQQMIHQTGANKLELFIQKENIC